ncbi:hypothetical protein Ancab_021753 [Ancistrocladus abbreviatus]
MAQGAHVGRAQDVEAIPLPQHRLREDGFPHCTVRHMGGDLVLISSPNAHSFQSMDMEDANRLAKWVEDIRPWTFSEVSHERSVWIRCKHRTHPCLPRLPAPGAPSSGWMSSQR